MTRKVGQRILAYVDRFGERSLDEGCRRDLWWWYREVVVQQESDADCMYCILFPWQNSRGVNSHRCVALDRHVGDYGIEM